MVIKIVFSTEQARAGILGRHRLERFRHRRRLPADDLQAGNRRRDQTGQLQRLDDLHRPAGPIKEPSDAKTLGPTR